MYCDNLNRTILFEICYLVWGCCFCEGLGLAGGICNSSKTHLQKTLYEGKQEQPRVKSLIQIDQAPGIYLSNESTLAHCSVISLKLMGALSHEFCCYSHFELNNQTMCVSALASGIHLQVCIHLILIETLFGYGHLSVT